MVNLHNVISRYAGIYGMSLILKKNIYIIICYILYIRALYTYHDNCFQNIDAICLFNWRTRIIAAFFTNIYMVYFRIDILHYKYFLKLQHGFACESGIALWCSSRDMISPDWWTRECEHSLSLSLTQCGASLIKAFSKHHRLLGCIYTIPAATSILPAFATS